ncbi:hypothetical protein B0A69_11240 [Chryseobacterium shigense]|nr:hypothetical protein B0A69_11240 [Chryseobacterium shigense]
MFFTTPQLDVKKSNLLRQNLRKVKFLSNYFFYSEIIISLPGNYQESHRWDSNLQNKQGATIDKPVCPEKMFILYFHPILTFLY